ncbi:MAG TPA: hypothetical protein VMX55_06055 [candidate division Zixibacteria bacterium]|nr:hypothetical protein [candidate division Zixibacteria bacterium]
MSKESTNKNKESKPKRKHIIDAFIFVDAINPQNPCTLKQLGLDLSLYESRINFMIQKELIIPIENREDNYYLDLEKYYLFKNEEDKRFFIMLVSIIIPGIIFLLLGLAWILAS